MHQAVFCLVHSNIIFVIATASETKQEAIQLLIEFMDCRVETPSLLAVTITLSRRVGQTKDGNAP